MIINKEEKMTSKNVEERAKLLEAMDTVIKALDNENAYYGNWLALGPGDGAGPDEYKDTAGFIDSEQGETSCYEDACKCFIKTIINYGNDGFYTGLVGSGGSTNKDYRQMLLDRADSLSKWYEVGDCRRMYASYEIITLYEYLTGQDSGDTPMKDMVEYVENFNLNRKGINKEII